MSDARRISIQAEAWPLRQRFAIARGAKLEAETICVEIRDGAHIGRGEAVPYGHYGETVESVTAAIEDLGPLIEAGMARDQLSDALFPGAAIQPWGLCCLNLLLDRNRISFGYKKKIHP